MRLIHTSLFAAIAALGLAACNQQPAAPQAETAPAAPADGATAEPAAAPAPAADASATAELAPTQGNETKGSVTFKVVDGKVHVTGQISGLKPGSEHGFHIHEKGDCSAPDGMSAGGHFNPGKQDHGSVSADPHHGGDMPNIKADDKGVATIDGPVSSNVNIGKGDDFDIIGRGLIVHADADDYKTQPTGNAGARLACVTVIPEGLSNTSDEARSETSVHRRYLAWLHHWAQALNYPGHQTSCHVLESGNVAQALIDYAVGNHVHVIVMGAATHGLKTQRLIATVPIKVAMAAPCTVCVTSG